jgi:hypothetical protein
VHGLRHGAGLYLSASGKVYNGNWKDDKRHGDGIQQDNIGIYDGQWLEGKRTGQGMYVSSAGGEKKVYAGQWVDNKQHGTGTFSLNGKVIQRGRWDRGTHVPPGALTWDEQTQQSVQWARDHAGGKDGRKRTHGSDRTVHSLVNMLTSMTPLEREEKTAFGAHAVDSLFAEMQQKLSNITLADAAHAAAAPVTAAAVSPPPPAIDAASAAAPVTAAAVSPPPPAIDAAAASIAIASPPRPAAAPVATTSPPPPATVSPPPPAIDATAATAPATAAAVSPPPPAIDAAAASIATASPPLPSTDDALTETGRRAGLALLSGVIANVPVRNCSIVRSVQNATMNGKEFTAGELLLLAWIKVPCAIDYLAQQLPHCFKERTRTAWREAVDKAVDHFRATCTGKDIDNMHPVYRQHKSASALSIESTSGLLAMQKTLAAFGIAQFHEIRAWAPAWHEDTLEQMAASLTDAPFRLGGTLYKRVHSIRSVVTALEFDDDDYANTWLKMSKSNDDALTLYPPHVDTPAKAVEWLYSQCYHVALKLSEPEVHQAVLSDLHSMTRGDEACFR